MHQLAFQATLVDARVRLEFAASITQQVELFAPTHMTGPKQFIIVVMSSYARAHSQAAMRRQLQELLFR